MTTIKEYKKNPYAQIQDSLTEDESLRIFGVHTQRTDLIDHMSIGYPKRHGAYWAWHYWDKDGNECSDKRQFSSRMECLMYYCMIYSIPIDPFRNI